LDHAKGPCCKLDMKMYEAKKLSLLKRNIKRSHAFKSGRRYFINDSIQSKQEVSSVVLALNV